MKNYVGAYVDNNDFCPVLSHFIEVIQQYNDQSDLETEIQVPENRPKGRLFSNRDLFLLIDRTDPYAFSDGLHQFWQHSGSRRK